MKVGGMKGDRGECGMHASRIYIGEREYPTLAAALDAARPDDEIRLIPDLRLAGDAKNEKMTGGWIAGTQPAKDEPAIVRDRILAEIRELPEADRSRTMEIANRMRELAWTNGPSGLFALALVGAEAAMGNPPAEIPQ